MASVKWLSRIELRTSPYEGQFQTKSYVYEWDNGERELVTKQRVKALMLTPQTGDVLPPGLIAVRGKAGRVRARSRRSRFVSITWASGSPPN